MLPLSSSSGLKCIFPSLVWSWNYWQRIVEKRRETEIERQLECDTGLDIYRFFLDPQASMKHWNRKKSRQVMKIFQPSCQCHQQVDRRVKHSSKIKMGAMSSVFPVFSVVENMDSLWCTVFENNPKYRIWILAFSTNFWPIKKLTCLVTPFDRKF